MGGVLIHRHTGMRKAPLFVRGDQAGDRRVGWFDRERRLLLDRSGTGSRSALRIVQRIPFGHVTSAFAHSNTT
jgi:hypothetical protein